jgi:hypothetical protein
MLLRTPLLATIAASCFASTVALADFRADYETVKGSADDNVPSVSRLELSGARLRLDTSRVSVLVDGDRCSPPPRRAAAWIR